jgi:hypothetical protein
MTRNKLCKKNGNVGIWTKKNLCIHKHYILPLIIKFSWMEEDIMKTLGNFVLVFVCISNVRVFTLIRKADVEQYVN